MAVVPLARRESGKDGTPLLAVARSGTVVERVAERSSCVVICSPP